MLLISKNIKGLMHNYMASTNCFSAILKYLNTHVLSREFNLFGFAVSTPQVEENL